MANANLAVYCSGLFGPGLIKEQIPSAQKSGFTTIILWSMHVGRPDVDNQSYGELIFNDNATRDNTITNKMFNPNNDPFIAKWPGDVAQLKENGSKVDKIFISMGGDSRFVKDFRTLEYMLDNGMADIIKLNFQALRDAFMVDGKCLIDGIDIDNEEAVKASTITDFCKILFEIGFEVTFCPYSSPETWRGYMKTLWDMGHKVSWWNLQCYSGGNGNIAPNKLQLWIDALSSVVGEGEGASYLVPGLAVQGATDSHPQQCPTGEDGMLESFQPVNNLGLAGGFAWTFDSIIKNGTPCGAKVAQASDYSTAILEGLSHGV